VFKQKTKKQKTTGFTWFGNLPTSTVKQQGEISKGVHKRVLNTHKPKSQIHQFHSHKSLYLVPKTNFILKQNNSMKDTLRNLLQALED